MQKRLKVIIQSILVAIFVLFFPVLSGVIVTICSIPSPTSLYIQAIFILIPFLIVIVLFVTKKIKRETLFFTFEKNIQKYSVFIPVLFIFLPVLVGGFKPVELSYFFGCFVLYLFVGITEETYFRGIIPALLKKEFSQNQVIFISSLLFGLGHFASAFQGQGVIFTILTIINALIFGFLAINLLTCHHSIFPLMVIHFLFDFETKFISLTGTDLGIAEAIRGTIMFIYAIILFVWMNKIKKKK